VDSLRIARAVARARWGGRIRPVAADAGASV